MVLCKFCQKEADYVPLTISRGGGGRRVSVYYCYNCKYEHSSICNWKNNHLYAFINNRMYRWSTEEKNKVARLWYVGEPGEPGVRPNKKMKLLQTFEEYFPNITPENIEHKLKFMLLFL